MLHKKRRRLESRSLRRFLRGWFCDEMEGLRVPDRYVDAFYGRVPKSVLARRYSDFSPEKLILIYEKAQLRILN